MSQKLLAIRELMKQNNVQAYLVPHSDAHDSEYTAEEDERLAYISGFTGSAGIALITLDVAYLWTDGRYFLQAPKELEQGWQLQKLQKGQQLWFEYIVSSLQQQSNVGFDPLLINAVTYQTRSQYLQKHQINLVPIEQNLVDLVWKDKKQPEIKQITIHQSEFNDRDTQQKIKDIFQSINTADQLITSKLDQIAWVLNLRGQDIDYNPLFKSYLILYKQGRGVLYVDQQKINQQVKEYLTTNQIAIKSYNDIFQDAPNFTLQTVVINSDCNQRLYSKIPSQIILSDLKNPIDLQKSIKSPLEQQGFINCHIRDGAIVAKYLAYVQNQLANKQEIDEFTGANVLESMRRQAKYNQGLSFDTISSVGANAAVIHYKPSKESAKKITTDQIYLLDSGGQYYDGTTDITRTTHFGQPTPQMIDAYTRVLLGNLDLERVRFPANSNINGSDLDVLARRWLWAAGLDYKHGTGHGVGYYLNVHEGPHGISKYRYEPLVPGVVISNEPGYYEENNFGIRIENLMLCRDLGNGFWGFENITICPYERKLIDKSLLSKSDIDYINQYHKRVRELLMKELEGDEIAQNWLIEKTNEI